MRHGSTVGHAARVLAAAVACALTVAFLVLSVAIHAPGHTTGWVRVAVSIAIVAGMSAVPLVVLRRPGNIIGLLLLAIGPTFALLLASSAAVDRYASTHHAIAGQAGFNWFEGWIGFVPFNALLPLLLLTFPDGRLLSRRWRWVAAATIIGAAAGAIGSAFAPGSLADNAHVTNPLGVHGTFGSFCAWMRNTVTWLVFLVVGLLSAVSVFLRRRRSTGLERQQLKWLFYAASLLALVFPAWFLSPHSLGPIVTEVAVAAVPVAVGVAVLRYRLYDIDRLISRTISYGLLSATVAGVFVLIVTAVTAVVPNQSQIAVAGATLVSAALVNPVRRRLQRLVDRRFNRAPIDAARTVDAFARGMTNEVELDAISDRLLGTIATTVEPTHASLWFAPSS